MTLIEELKQAIMSTKGKFATDFNGDNHVSRILQRL